MVKLFGFFIILPLLSFGVALGAAIARAADFVLSLWPKAEPEIPPTIVPRCDVVYAPQCARVAAFQARRVRREPRHISAGVGLRLAA